MHDICYALGRIFGCSVGFGVEVVYRLLAFVCVALCVLTLWSFGHAENGPKLCRRRESMLQRQMPEKYLSSQCACGNVYYGTV